MVVHLCKLRHRSYQRMIVVDLFDTDRELHVGSAAGRTAMRGGVIDEIAFVAACPASETCHRLICVVERRRVGHEFVGGAIVAARDLLEAVGDGFADDVDVLHAGSTGKGCPMAWTGQRIMRVPP